VDLKKRGLLRQQRFKKIRFKAADLIRECDLSAGNANDNVLLWDDRTTCFFMLRPTDYRRLPYRHLLFQHRFYYLSQYCP